jgi:hypothetical protein
MHVADRGAGTTCRSAGQSGNALNDQAGARQTDEPAGDAQSVRVEHRDIAVTRSAGFVAAGEHRQYRQSRADAGQHPTGIKRQQELPRRRARNDDRHARQQRREDAGAEREQDDRSDHRYPGAAPCAPRVR